MAPGSSCFSRIRLLPCVTLLTPLETKSILITNLRTFLLAFGPLFDVWTSPARVVRVSRLDEGADQDPALGLGEPGQRLVRRR
jgi:hypothetical protein